MRFAKEAWPFVVPFAVAAVALAAFGWPVWGSVVAILGVGVLLFFRDPKRSFEGDPGTLLAPADGLVTRIDTVENTALGPGKYRRIVTFLSAFDVHVQRVPVTGVVESSTLTPGRKVAAFRPDAGEINECHLTVLRRSGDAAGAGDRIGICQIAGLMARRVVCYLAAGDSVERGQHLGVIKFGSRVDLLVPDGYEVLVEKGERVKNGETPMARSMARSATRAEAAGSEVAADGEGE